MLTTLSLALPLTAPLLQSSSPAEVPSVVRSYDVRSAIPILGASPHSLVLLPISRDYSDGYSITGIEGRVAASTFLSFLRALDPAQWDYPQRELALDDEHWLTVRAPTTLQDVVARSLVFLDDTLARPTIVHVDIVTFGPNPGVSTLPSLLPNAEVARWTALGTGHESYELILRPGASCTQLSERSIDLALEADPIVAERAVGWVLRPERITVGTALECSVSPAKNGTWLAFTLRNGRIIDPDATHALNLVGSVTHDQGIAHIEGPKSRSDPRIANHSLAINAFLPEGKALAYVTNAGLESRVVFVRQVGAGAPPVVTLPDDLKRVTSRNATTMMRTDAVNVPSVSVTRTDPDSSPVELKASASDPALFAVARSSSRVVAVDRLRTFTDDYEFHELGPFVGLFGSKREVIEQAATRFTDLAPTPQLVAVTVTLRRGTRDTTTLARATLPIRVGSASTVVLGRESLYDMSALGDVAQGTIAMDVVVGRAFDGIVLTLEPRMTAGGALSLDVDAHARWSRTTPRDFDMGAKTSPRIQLPDADLLVARRTQALAKAENGPRKFTLGNAGTSSEALTLEFEVVDLR